MSSNSLERRLHRDTMLKVVGTTVTLLALLALLALFAAGWGLFSTHDKGMVTARPTYTAAQNTPPVAALSSPLGPQRPWAAEAAASAGTAAAGSVWLWGSVCVYSS